MLRIVKLLTGWVLVGVAVFGAAVAVVYLADRYFPTSGEARPSADVVATRFPETALPVIERSRPVPIPAGLTPELPAPSIATSGVAAPEGWSPRISVEQFLAAVDALRPPAAPVRLDAVFNDTQIAAIRDRLRLTRAQQADWPPLEAALRQLSWERQRGVNGPSLTPESLERLRIASAGLLAKLTAQQKSEIRLLTRVAGLNFGL